MKHPIALFLTLASAFVINAAAQTSPAAAAPLGPARIAVISFQAALAQTNEGQRAFGDLQKKFEPKRTQFKSMSDEIEALTKQLQAQGATLTDAQRAGSAKAIEDKKKKAQRFGEDAQHDFEQEMQQVYGGLASKVGNVMAEYAKQQGYALVVDRSESDQQAPIVLYANPAIDITKPVVDAYNLKSGVPPPAAQPAAAAPKPAAKPAAAH